MVKRWEDRKTRGMKTGVMGKVESKILSGRITVPFLLNGVECWGMRDDGSDMTLVDVLLKEVLRLTEKLQEIKLYDAKGMST